MPDPVMPHGYPPKAPEGRYWGESVRSARPVEVTPKWNR